MLSVRERNIVRLLGRESLSGEALADVLQVSRRTIVRDINAINHKLAESGIAHIEGGQCYTLHVFDKSGLEQLLSNVLAREDVLLFELLTRAQPSVMHLAEDLYTAPAGLRKQIDAINALYQDYLCIVGAPRQGLEVQMLGLSKVDFLAALAQGNPHLELRLSETLAHAQVVCSVHQEPWSWYKEQLTPSLSAKQLRLLMLAAHAVGLMQDAYAPNPAAQESAAERARAVFEDKQALHLWLYTHRTQLLALINTLLAAHGIRGTQPDVASFLFEHIVRAALFPTITAPDIREQMRQLQRSYPLEFDFATELSQELYALNAQLFIERAYLALYVIAYVGDAEPEPLSVLLYETRPSVASINEFRIKHDLERARIKVAFNPDELAAYARSTPFDLCIRDDATQIDKPTCITWDMVKHGVLSAAELNAIREQARVLALQKDLPRCFAPAAFLPMQQHPRSYLDFLREGLAQLVTEGLLAASDADLVMTRELQGERLEFSGVALPHAVSPQHAETFRIYALVPELPVYDGDEVLHLVMIVFAAQNQADKNSIFTYLYGKLGPDALPDGIKPQVNYDELLSLLMG